MSEMIAQGYSWLRAMSGGKLTSAQVVAGDKVIESLGFQTFADMIGFAHTVSGVTGQWDISNVGYDLIKQFEGFRADAYLDTGGVWTIGYGTIKYPNGVKVKKGDKVTVEQAVTYLKSDCGWVDSCLDSKVKVKISQNQFDALASFVYNVGESQFGSSTLLRKINLGDLKGAGMEFDRWVFDNGKRIEGLANRRAKEKAIFLAG